MRIAFYSPFARHLDLDLARGGDPIFLHSLLAALGERGHTVEVMSRFNVHDLWRGSVPVRRLFSEALAIRERVRRFNPDAWLIYEHSRTYPDLFGWWQQPKRYVLLSAHMWRSKRVPRHWRWLFDVAHRRALIRADRVLASRQTSAKRLLRRGISPERLSVLPPGVKIWPDMPSQLEARRSLGLTEGGMVILSVSRFTGSKTEPTQRKTEMILNVLAASDVLPRDARLVIVGDGPGRPLVESEVASLGLQGRVRLAGAVPHDQLFYYYAACDVYAYPLDLDIPRLSIMEAQGCGRPVVAMRSDSAELTVDDGCTGLLANNLEEFRQALGALAGDRPRREAMGLAARDYVARFHSIEVRASQIEAQLRGQALAPQARELVPGGSLP